VRLSKVAIAVALSPAAPIDRYVRISSARFRSASASLFWCNRCWDFFMIMVVPQKQAEGNGKPRKVRSMSQVDSKTNTRRGLIILAAAALPPSGRSMIDMIGGEPGEMDRGQFA
jgi:hypothetical protein